ncbi:MAG TPA: hypothetical protein VF137_05830 [Candidatus Dormibacteraeota bacterium]
MDEREEGDVDGGRRRLRGLQPAAGRIVDDLPATVAQLVTDPVGRGEVAAGTVPGALFEQPLGLRGVRGLSPPSWP